jgi:hypothetical protein
MSATAASYRSGTTISLGEPHASTFLTGLLASQQDPEQRKNLHQYAIWHLVRRLRRRSNGRPLTPQQFTSARQRTHAAVAFLTWLQAHDLALNARPRRRWTPRIGWSGTEIVAQDPCLERPHPAPTDRRPAVGRCLLSGKRVPSEVLKAARLPDSQTKRAKVPALLHDMVACGEPVTFAASPRPPGYRTGGSTPKASASTSAPPAPGRPCTRRSPAQGAQ